eukprot:m.4535 g.4535  ORF g.4535 m.4535 type:complete len:82 (-) comp3010_c0_seq1:2395-2640(-)
MSAPRVTKQERLACWEARDKFFACDDKNKNVTPSPCEELRKSYEKQCPIAWVKHFNKRRIYLLSKQKLDEVGWQEVKEEGK